MNAPFHLRVSESVRWRRFDRELIVVDLGRGQYYGLTDVAALVFEGVASNRPRNEVTDSLLEDYDVPRSDLERDIDQFLGKLVALELLTVNRDA